VFTFGQLLLALYGRLPVAIFTHSLENHKASIVAHLSLACACQNIYTPSQLCDSIKGEPR